MKWLIASDLHGSAECCKMLMDAFAREGAERLLLLGDVLHAGLIEGDKAAVADMLNGIKDKISCVRGNCDSDGDLGMLDFPVEPEYTVFPVGDKLMFATHGHLYTASRLPPMGQGDILLHGHTHVPATEPHPTFLYLNPGSVSRPLWGSEKSYMTWEGRTFLWKTLDGREYRRYEV